MSLCLLYCNVYFCLLHSRRLFLNFFISKICSKFIFYFYLSLLVHFLHRNVSVSSVCYFYGPSPASFSFIFVFSIQWTVNVQYKVCRRLPSNRGPLVSEATESHHCPSLLFLCLIPYFLSFSFSHLFAY